MALMFAAPTIADVQTDPSASTGLDRVFVVRTPQHHIASGLEVRVRCRRARRVFLGARQMFKPRVSDLPQAVVRGLELRIVGVSETP
jgi:hypothetical protein